MTILQGLRKVFNFKIGLSSKSSSVNSLELGSTVSVEKMVSMKHFPGQPAKMCSTHHLGVVIVERCFPSCTWGCHIFSDVIMRKHFKNSKCSRDAKFFLSLPASPAAGADSPSGEPRRGCEL